MSRPLREGSRESGLVWTWTFLSINGAFHFYWRIARLCRSIDKMRMYGADMGNWQKNVNQRQLGLCFSSLPRYPSHASGGTTA